MNTLLKFDKNKYEATIKSVTDFALNLVKASEEIEKLDAGKFEPKDLKDGNFTQRVLDYYKKEWSSNTAFKHITFEKYLQFIELDLTSLKLIQKHYNDTKDYVYSFYQKNDLYFNYCEYRNKEGLKGASSKVEIKILDMFELNRKSITVSLNEEYFKLYTTSKAQEEKIKEISTFIDLCKKFQMDYKAVKQALGEWVKELNYSLDSFEINYNHLLAKIK
tara:strand:- start:190209 stop:190865 length:657 start_codon:yes stop_codon:yes gene_type:complete